MRSTEKNLEFKVGIFVFVGLCFIALMVVQFGRLGEGLRRYYPLTVDFPNASGLRKGAEVLMGGARIGWVADAPHIREDGLGVRVELKIIEEVRIPAEAKIQIGSSGLLGDRFVDVMMTGKPSGEYLDEGALVEGLRESGFDDLGREGVELLQELRETVSQVSGVIERVDQELLTVQTMEDLRVSMSSLRETAETLSEASTQIEEVLGGLGDALSKGEAALDTLQATMESAERTVGAAELAMEEDVRPALNEAREAIADVRVALVDALEGDGLLATMVNDPALAEDVRRLAANLRRHGILFYRDREVVEEGEVERTAPERLRRHSPRRR